jgi:hypothetical protein
MTATDCPYCAHSNTRVDCRAVCDSCRCYFTVALTDPIVSILEKGEQGTGDGLDGDGLGGRVEEQGEQGAGER